MTRHWHFYSDEHAYLKLNSVRATEDKDVKVFAWSRDDILPSWYHLALVRVKGGLCLVSENELEARETESDSKKTSELHKEAQRNTTTGWAIYLLATA